jgi:hypothetical protein
MGESTFIRQPQDHGDEVEVVEVRDRFDEQLAVELAVEHVGGADQPHGDAGREPAAVDTGGHQLVALHGDGGLDAVDGERPTLSLPLRDAGVGRAREPHADLELGIGDEHHLGAVARGALDDADQSGRAHHGHADLHAVVGAGGDLDGVVEVADRTRHHLGELPGVVADVGDVDLAQHAPQRLGVARRVEALAFEVAQLLAQPFVLGLELAVVEGPVPGVAHR